MAKPTKQTPAPAKTRKEILEALGAFQRQGAWENAPSSVAHALKNETDRGLIVVAGSHTEDYLLMSILEKFPPVARPLQKDLTRSGGPLGSWAQQISIALALGIIDEEDARDLEVFKTMRNACAHSRQRIDFDTPELRDAMGLLMVPGISSLPKGKSWRDIFRRMLAYNVRYFMDRMGGETPKKTPAERFLDWLQHTPRAEPKASTEKQRQQLSKVASQDQPKPAR